MCAVVAYASPSGGSGASTLTVCGLQPAPTPADPAAPLPAVDDQTAHGALNAPAPPAAVAVSSAGAYPNASSASRSERSARPASEAAASEAAAAGARAAEAAAAKALHFSKASPTMPACAHLVSMRLRRA